MSYNACSGAPASSLKNPYQPGRPLTKKLDKGLKRKRAPKKEYTPPTKRFKTETGTGIPTNGKLLEIIRDKFGGSGTHETLRDFLGTRKDKTALYERLNSLTKRGFLSASTTKKQNSRKWVKLYTLTNKCFADADVAKKPATKKVKKTVAKSVADKTQVKKSKKAVKAARVKHAPSCVIKPAPREEGLTYEPHRVVLEAVQALGGKATHQEVKSQLGVPENAETRKKTTWHRRLGVLSKRGYLRMVGKSTAQGLRKQNIYAITQKGKDELRKTLPPAIEMSPSPGSTASPPQTALFTHASNAEAYPPPRTCPSPSMTFSHKEKPSPMWLEKQAPSCFSDDEDIDDQCRKMTMGSAPQKYLSTSVILGRQSEQGMFRDDRPCKNDIDSLVAKLAEISKTRTKKNYA